MLEFIQGLRAKLFQKTLFVFRGLSFNQLLFLILLIARFIERKLLLFLRNACFGNGLKNIDFGPLRPKIKMELPNKVDLFICRLFGDDIPPKSVSKYFLYEFRVVSFSNINCVSSVLRSFVPYPDTVIY